MSRKYIKLCTGHKEGSLSYPERFDISYLFHEEMQQYCGVYGTDYFDFALTDKNIEWIKKYYHLYNLTENFHDKEPHVDLDINDPDFDRVFNKLYRENWYERMTVCNWFELYHVGVWHYSDEYVVGYGNHCMDKVRELVSRGVIDVPYNKYEKNGDTYKVRLSYRNRMFTDLNRRKNDECFSVYWFGRDIEGVDYVWQFEKK